MAAEIKQIQPGIHLMFLGDNVSAEEVQAQMALYQDALAGLAEGDPVLLLDCVYLANPLRVARLLAAETMPGQVVVINSNRAGAVLGERLRQRLSGATVTLRTTQQDALTFAKDLRGTHHLEDDHCNYLGMSSDDVHACESE